MLATIALWAIAITFLGYWRTIVTWGWGNIWIFWFQSLPLSIVILVSLLGLEALFFRWRDRSRRP
jgi:hypothetical protein